MHRQKRNFSGFMPWIVCGVGALFYCYEYFLRIAPSVMSADLIHTYRINATVFGHLSAFYYYAYTPMQLIVGVLMDRYGPRRLLVLACASCALGSYLFAMAPTLACAEAGRFFVGFGSAFAFVGVLKLATVWLPPQHFAFIAGLSTALGMLGAMFGDIFLTMMVSHQGWRNTLILSAMAGIFLTVIIFFVVRDSRKDTLHPPQVLSFAPLIEGLFYLIRSPQIWINGIIGCLAYTTASAFAELWGIPYLQEAYGFSPAVAASANSAVFLGWVVGGPLAGFFSDRIKRRRLPIFIGSVLTAIVLAVLLIVPQLPVTTAYILLFLVGLFSGFQILVFAIAKELSPTAMAGTGIALTNMLVMLGGSIFQPVIGWLLDFNWNGLLNGGIRVYSVSDYRLALTVLPLAFVGVTFLASFLKETYKEENV